MDNWIFSADDSILYNKVGIKTLNILEKCWSPICFIVKKRYAIEDMSAQDLFSYTYIKLYTNKFNLWTGKNSCSDYISVWYMNIMWCREYNLCFWTKANKAYVQLITKNKSFNVWQNTSQSKSRFYTKIMVFLKLSLLHVHLRGDAMALQQLLMYLPCMLKMCL